MKDRIGVSMIEALESAAQSSRANRFLIEPTSGNTGIALAFVLARPRLQADAGHARAMSIRAPQDAGTAGAELVLTPAAAGHERRYRQGTGADRATPGAIMPQQFENPANPDIHRARLRKKSGTIRTARSTSSCPAWSTGGTITGVGQVLKPRKPDLKVVAVEPEDSPILSGGQPGPHKIQGIGAGLSRRSSTARSSTRW